MAHKEAVQMDVAQTAEKLVGWMKEMRSRTGTKGGVFGVSGGVDSALTVALARRAWDMDCLGLVLPIESAKADVKDAVEVLRHFGCPYKVIDLGPAYRSLLSCLEGTGLPEDLPSANLKPRLRMIALYYHANLMNYLVSGSENRAEIYIGYSTKYGDAAADIMPLAHLTKAEVKAMARHLGVPQSIVERVPSAGLWEGQTDEEELGITYADLDAYLSGLPVSEAAKEKIEGRHRSAAHKWSAPLFPELV